ncbi:(4Fe-4S)-binding protein [Clostridium bowmanii]|uniref:(4Fe-4S)-binding protein n=1 Tax=Clostridium bowmanii TaxID=132925 RepID=UPI001CD2C0FD|nr:(4Fe-4S)-binding protein [Clostridium bowmanii]MCA1074264.1 (4Fe-4S)-binding protein [Clostridium bowmanii]
MNKISEVEIRRVKGMGFLANNDGVHFSARIITENGVLSSRQLVNVSEASEKYGNGTIAFTVRLTLEIPGIEFENIEAVREYIAKEEMITGGTGPKVRPVVSCKGTVCTFGLFDTQAMAKEIHKNFFEKYNNVILPHKFKIAVGGCPNNCVKPDLNDFGVIGQLIPKYNTDKCVKCKKCLVESTCPMGAAKFIEGTLSIDKEICNNCGRCIDKCHFDAMEQGMHGYKIYIGGRWGKSIRHGSIINKIFTKEEIMSILLKTILFFKDNAFKGERFGSVIDRLGFEYVEAEILSDEILKRKDEILNLPIRIKREQA